MPYDIRPLTPDLWPALEELFGPRGAVNGCWCMYWRIGAAYHKRPRHENRDDFRAIVGQGPPPGLLAFDGDMPVGWCQVTPREALPRLQKSRSLKPVDDQPVWALSCLFIRVGHRRKGVATSLIEAAIDFARHADAPALEAYPLDAALTRSTSFTGYATTFERAGFRTVARRKAAQQVMRYEFGRKKGPVRRAAGDA